MVKRLREKTVVGVIELIDVGTFHLPFIRAVTQGNALHQGIRAGLQVDQQVRFLDFLRQRFMYFIVHIELVTFEVDLGKERILRKRIIGEEVPARGDQLVHRPTLLMIATQQKEYLRLKGVAFAIGVKIGEKGILLKNFQKDFSIECILKKAGEGRLADSNDPFDGNVHGRLQQ